jgi:DNA-binding NarL/FixJ family response regulator
MQSLIHVLLATDVPALGRSLSKSLQAAPDLRLVRWVQTGNDALHIALAQRPNLAIVDLNISRDDLHVLVTRLFKLRVAVLLMGDEFEHTKTVEFLSSGADGIIARDIPQEMLYKSIRAVAAGQIWVSRQTVNHMVKQIRTRTAAGPSPATPPVEQKSLASNSPDVRQYVRLTRRELEVVRAIGEAMTNKEIASHFGISEFTVKHHLTKIFDKIGVYSRLELAMFAMEFRLLETQESE